jgi:hypothetical protein
MIYSIRPAKNVILIFFYAKDRGGGLHGTENTFIKQEHSTDTREYLSGGRQNQKQERGYNSNS